MRITETGCNGLYIIEPKIFNDARGYFFESFNISLFKSSGIDFNPVQDNESCSCFGVVRGLHYQLDPAAQAKLIRVINGSIFDVVVDLRRESPTFGRWFGVELDGDKKRQLFIPRGFAHGFSVLSSAATIQYKCDNLYNPAMERSINPFDPELAIDWKTKRENAVISAKDSAAPRYADAETNF
jgi:dTDP-4-dehydrorhamnose 3,5-epimerase